MMAGILSHLAQYCCLYVDRFLIRRHIFHERRTNAERMSTYARCLRLPYCPHHAVILGRQPRWRISRPSQKSRVLAGPCSPHSAESKRQET